MHRVPRNLFVASLLAALAMMCASVEPAAGDGAPPTFAPQFTPAPSPTEPPTMRPTPLSRPEDAHGISQTMPPPPSPSAYVPPQVPPALWLSSAPSFLIPCSTHANRIYVPVVINGRLETFLLDSAAPFSSIDPSAAPSHDAPIRLSTVQIGALRFNGLVASVSRISSSSRAALGAPADGILGQELFSRFPVLISYDPCTITVFHDGPSSRAALSSGAYEAPLHMMHGLPALDATFDGDSAARLVVDTSSDADVDVTREFATTSAAAFTLTSTQTRRWLPSGALSGQRARIRTLTLGPLSFDHPNISIFPMGVPPGGIAGYVGNGLLQRYAMLLDEPDLIAAFAEEKSR